MRQRGGVRASACSRGTVRTAGYCMAVRTPWGSTGCCCCVVPPSTCATAALQWELGGDVFVPCLSPVPVCSSLLMRCLECRVWAQWLQVSTAPASGQTQAQVLAWLLGSACMHAGRQAQHACECVRACNPHTVTDARVLCCRHCKAWCDHSQRQPVAGPRHR